MDEVLEALESNQLDFYTLDGQMSIVEDYLSLFPEREKQLKNLSRRADSSSDLGSHKLMK